MSSEGERRWREFVARVQAGESIEFPEHWTHFRDAYRDHPVPLAWWPDEAARERSHLESLRRRLGLSDYAALHAFSVERREAFWEHVIDELGIVFEREPDAVLDPSRGVEEPGWLRGARLDITESCFTTSPDRIAIVYGREEPPGELERISYGELARRVDDFAGALRSEGFETDDAVALYMPMTPDCVVAYLGVVRAGGRVVSIADSFSAEELRRRCEIAGARLVVTVGGYQRSGRRLDPYAKVRDAATGAEPPMRAIVAGADRVYGDDIRWEDFVASPKPPGRLAHAPDHVVNVLFSSGTTGDPKAIPWTELTPLKAGMDARFHQDVHEDDVVCWPTNIGWMMGPWLIFASLLNDATMALFEGAPTGAGFTRFVKDAGVTVLGVVPSIVRHWRATDAVDEDSWARVRLFSSTGEASNREDYLWLMSRARYRAPVIEYLGGTEIGGGHLTGTVVQGQSPATFSTPALGVDVVALDEAGAPVEAGGTGELFLIPPALGLSERLLNRDHHSVYFEGCPAGPRGETLRRHGDEVAVLPDGYFRAEGRADDTMNLGGIKVGALELERVVNEHPVVFESAAVAVPSEGGGASRLVVYVVVEEGVETAGLDRELARRIGERLNPLFKLHELVPVDSLPRTASNKIMRRRLRDAYRAR